MEGRRELTVNRLPVRIANDERRVITRLFVIDELEQLQKIIERVGSLGAAEVEETLALVLSSFEGRHANLRDAFERHYRQVCELTGCEYALNERQRLLMGSYFTMEYSLESAALFNPSIVPHPDQNGLREGEVRFVMSLRATGEGHVSSVVFRCGVIGRDGDFRLDPPARFPRATLLAPDQVYLKSLFRRSLSEMSVRMGLVDRVLKPLGDEFTFTELQQRVQEVQREPFAAGGVTPETFQAILWLARSNYQLLLPASSAISDLVIFPRAEHEAHGVEDVRLVRFVEEDGSTRYFGTYTAYSGFRIFPMLLETQDFHRIGVHTLNGAAARNKGMALFPRRIDGHYAMCSRLDGQNLYIMYSDMVHFWESATLLARPRYPWEFMLMGNCGSPIETEEGWLLLTHGVGPMRRYCISAMLLDLEDPSRVIGRLRQPLLAPMDEEREGYVPNVVYSCGSMAHEGMLYLPYAMADRSTTVATVSLDCLLDALRRSPD